MYEGYKVKILTIKGKPKGICVTAGFLGGSLSPIVWQVRLSDGTIIKDLRDHEIKLLDHKKPRIY